MRTLRTRMKAFIAERYGKFVKSKLFALMKQNGTRRWIDYLTPVINEHNRGKISGTHFKRNQIDSSNFFEFMAEKHRVKDFAIFLNSSRIMGSNILNKKWLKDIFKFQVGDRVLLARKVSPGEKGSFAIKKPSHVGYFSESIYRVYSRELASTKKLSLLPGL